MNLFIIGNVFDLGHEYYLQSIGIFVSFQKKISLFL